MRAGTVFLTLCALAVSDFATAKEPVVTEPGWAEPLSAETVAEHYPKIGTMLELEGVAVLRCGVSRDGKATDCTVSAEAPAGLGFGAAAMELSALMRLRPKLVDGVAVDDGQVRIPVRFRLPDDPSVEPAKGAASPEQVALAARFADMVVDQATLAETFEKLVREVESEPLAGVAESTRQDAARAVRTAFLKRKDEVRELVARPLAGLFSPEELQGLLTFAASPGGKSLQGRRAPFEPAKLGADIRLDVSSQVHEAVCASRPCSPTAAESELIDRPVPAVDLDQPVWKRSPTPETLTKSSPLSARLAGVTGKVRLVCKTGPKGRLESCEVTSEAPAGWGYGSAALRLSNSYELDGQSTPVGQKVVVRTSFPAQALPPVEKPAPIIPSRGYNLALQLVVVAVPNRSKDMQKTFRNLVEISSEGLSPENSQALFSAVDIAAVSAFQSAQQQIAVQLASQLTESELEALSALVSGPAGRALLVRWKDIDEVTKSVGQQASRIIGEEARTSFCKLHDCGSQITPQPTAASPAPSTRKP